MPQATKRTLRVNYYQQAVNSLRTGAKFGWEISLPHYKKNLNILYRRRRVSRSSKIYNINGSPSYAYALPEYEGQTLKWTYQNQNFADVFNLCPIEKAELKNRGIRGSFQNSVAEVLKDQGALFAPEIQQRLAERGVNCNLRNVWKALGRLKKAGQVTVFDEPHGGWKFAHGNLVALADDERAFSRRLDSVDEKVVTSTERRLLTKIRNAIYPAKELKEELGVDDSIFTFIMKKYAKESPFTVKAEGKGTAYHIEVSKDRPDAQLRGRGLISWLRYIDVFGSLVLYDQEHVPEGEVVDFLKRFGYWLSEEGRRRVEVGRVWEKYVEDFFGLLDQNRLWQLNVIEHKRNYRTRSGHEIDHWYVIQVGPKELNLTMNLLFECKSGIITSSQLDEFYTKSINEPEFRNWQTGGLKSNTFLVMLTGKTADAAAFRKASQMGIRVVLHTAMEDLVAKITGTEKVTFRKVAQQAAVEAKTA